MRQYRNAFCNILKRPKNQKWREIKVCFLNKLFRSLGQEENVYRRGLQRENRSPTEISMNCGASSDHG